jgi:uncharacterized damage-inducible protein DinB
MTLLEELLEAWNYTRSGVIAEIENLPDERFMERPAGLQRSPLELANHIIESARLMSGELSRADADFLRKPYPQLLAEHSRPDDLTNSKTAAIEALRRSHHEGATQLAAAGEVQMLQLVRQFNGALATRLAWMHHGIAHEEYHRGQLAMYARLFGKTPALTMLIEGN